MSTDAELFQARRRIDALENRIDELGRLHERQADRIRCLEGELSKVAATNLALRSIADSLQAAVQAMADEAHWERHYRQTGTLPAKPSAEKVVSSLVGDALTEREVHNSRTPHPPTAEPWGAVSHVPELIVTGEK